MLVRLDLLGKPSSRQDLGQVSLQVLNQVLRWPYRRAYKQIPIYFSSKYANHLTWPIYHMVRHQILEVQELRDFQTRCHLMEFHPMQTSDIPTINLFPLILATLAYLLLLLL
jgi:hypothetical protein